MPETQAKQLRYRLATIFEDEEPRSAATRLFNTLLAVLIIASVATVVLESVESIRRQYSAAFTWFEPAVTAVFAVEYGLRVWACVDFRDGRYRHFFWGRLRYMRSFFALVDLVSVLPAVLGIIGAVDLRVLRLLRLLRMLKLIRHSTTFGLLWAVLCDEARSILALLFILLLTVTISGALMFMLESEFQPEVFTSIPVAMWWAIETLTTVGYGDMVPMTVGGRMLGGMVSIIGIGTLALFSGLITIGFLDQLKTYREQRSGSPAPADDRAVDRSKAGARDEPRASPTELTALNAPAPIATGQTLAVCPHCGSVLAHRTAL